jgi:HSP20 family protein
MNMRNLIPWGRETQVSAPRSNDDVSPFLSLHRQMNRLFDDFFHDFDGPTLRGGGWPSLELVEDETGVVVSAELPGLEEKDIDVNLRDGVLTIQGEKQQENKSSLYSERWHGSFARSVQLGTDIDPDRVSATFKNGVLTVKVERRPEAQSRSRRIAINKGA